MGGALAHWAARLAISAVFKLFTVPQARALIFARNASEYSSVWGPTFTDMLAKYNTWEEIILATMRINAGLRP